MLSSHRQDWPLPEGNFESAETLLAMNSPNAVHARKPYMLVKLCVPAACCFAITLSALSLTYMHADPALRRKQQSPKQK